MLLLQVECFLWVVRMLEVPYYPPVLKARQPCVENISMVHSNSENISMVHSNSESRQLQLQITFVPGKGLFNIYGQRLVLDLAPSFFAN